MSTPAGSNIAADDISVSPQTHSNWTKLPGSRWELLAQRARRRTARPNVDETATRGVAGLARREISRHRSAQGAAAALPGRRSAG